MHFNHKLRPLRYSGAFLSFFVCTSSTLHLSLYGIETMQILGRNITFPLIQSWKRKIFYTENLPVLSTKIYKNESCKRKTCLHF